MCCEGPIFISFASGLFISFWDTLMNNCRMAVASFCRMFVLFSSTYSSIFISLIFQMRGPRWRSSKIPLYGRWPWGQWRSEPSCSKSASDSQSTFLLVFGFFFLNSVRCRLMSNALLSHSLILQDFTKRMDTWFRMKTRVFVEGWIVPGTPGGQWDQVCSSFTKCDPKGTVYSRIKNTSYSFYLYFNQSRDKASSHK